MKRSFSVNVVTAVVLIGVPVAGLYGGSWLLSGPADAPAPPAVVESAPTVEPAAKIVRYDSVSAYFRAGYPNATTYRLGETWIERKSFSRSQRAQIHRENGGCCQVAVPRRSLRLNTGEGFKIAVETSVLTWGACVTIATLRKRQWINRCGDSGISC